MLDRRRMQRNRKRLEDERARLQQEVERMEVPSDERERPGYGNHMADSASEVFEQTKNLAVCQRLRRTLELVNKALDKMDEGVYGPCESCGEAIDPARLKALPYAALCISCQTRAERGAFH